MTFTNFHRDSDKCSFNIRLTESDVLFTCDFDKLYTNIDNFCHDLSWGAKIEIKSTDKIVLKNLKLNYEIRSISTVKLVITSKNLHIMHIDLRLNSIPFTSEMGIALIDFLTQIKIQHSKTPVISPNMTFTNFHRDSNNCSFNINTKDISTLFTCDFHELYTSIDTKMKILNNGFKMIIASNATVVLTIFKSGKEIIFDSKVEFIINRSKIYLMGDGAIYLTPFPPNGRQDFVNFLKYIQMEHDPEPPTPPPSSNITRQILMEVEIPKYFDFIKDLSYETYKRIESIVGYDFAATYDNDNYTCLILKRDEETPKYHICVMKENEWHDFDLPYPHSMCNVKDIPLDIINYSLVCFIDYIQNC